jgi:hypothetical protein
MEVQHVYFLGATCGVVQEGDEQEDKQAGHPMCHQGYLHQTTALSSHILYFVVSSLGKTLTTLDQLTENYYEYDELCTLLNA